MKIPTGARNKLLKTVKMVMEPLVENIHKFSTFGYLETHNGKCEFGNIGFLVVQVPETFAFATYILGVRQQWQRAVYFP